MTLLLIVLLPLCGAMLPLLLGQRSRKLAGLSAGLVVTLALALLLSLSPGVFAPDLIAVSWPWVPALGLSLSLHLDGLAFLFGLLSLGIGLLVVVYAYFYMYKSDNLGRFYAFLLLFMGAMVGVVLSANLLLMVVFWELTSLSSFLLIGYNSDKSESRQGARMAMAITGGGGLALLAGVMLLYQVVGSLDLYAVLGAREQIIADPRYMPILILVLLGAFTKSAQFPFHFWLPGAMAAPTPVSAYLHSATMVKAGVFLMARLHPALASTNAWVWLVGGAGFITLLFAAYTALFKHDLKGLLAYSTISHLGLITLLFGISTPMAVVAALFHIMNHATFKASLFMIAGIVDHQTGTRDMRVLSGLRHKLPWLMVLTAMASAAMAGVPLFNGFLSKEMFFAETFNVSQLGAWAWMLPVGATLGGICSVAYSLRLVRETFFGPEATALPKEPHALAMGLKLPVEVLVLLSVAVGIVPALTAGPLLHAVAASTLQDTPPTYILSIWHGFNLPLLMSGIALIGGVALGLGWPKLAALHARAGFTLSAKAAFDALVRGLYGAASWITAALEDQSLQRYLALVIGAALVVGLSTMRGVFAGMRAPLLPDMLSVGALTILVTASVAVCLYHRERLVALVLLSVPGLIVSLAFVRFAAPDLALTQLSVEVVTIILLALAMHYLPQYSPVASSATRRARDILLAVSGGGGVAALSYAIMTRTPDSIAHYYLAQSVPGGGGKNVVNVILVDFRGFDTMGELTVFAIAALAVSSLLKGRYIQGPKHDGEGRPWTKERHPMVLSMLTRPLLPFALLVGIYIFWRGHNAPGGGFVAGLIVGVALMVQLMANGLPWVKRRLKIPGVVVIGLGLSLALLTGLGSLWFKRPFLTSAHAHFELPLFGDVELATALLFDTGVLLVVVGVVIMVLVAIGAVGNPKNTQVPSSLEAKDEDQEVR